MAEDELKPQEIIESIDYKPPKKGWIDTTTKLTKGRYCYSGGAKFVEYLDLPHPREWKPYKDDWKLPENWQEIIFEGMRERLDKYRAFRLFMDICVRCGACADKCHFFIGSGDPKNMPVLRAELLRAIYRKNFTLAGRFFLSKHMILRSLKR